MTATEFMFVLAVRHSTLQLLKKLRPVPPVRRLTEIHPDQGGNCLQLWQFGVFSVFIIKMGINISSEKLRRHRRGLCSGENELMLPGVCN